MSHPATPHEAAYLVPGTRLLTHTPLKRHQRVERRGAISGIAGAGKGKSGEGRGTIGRGHLGSQTAYAVDLGNCFPRQPLRLPSPVLLSP